MSFGVTLLIGLQLIPVAVGQFWSDTDPPRADSKSREAEPAGDPATAERSSFATDPPRADSVSREAEPADDSVRVMSPMAFYRSSELIGKVSAAGTD